MQQFHVIVTTGGLFQSHSVRDSEDTAQTHAMYARVIYARLGRGCTAVVAECPTNCTMRS